MRHYYSKITIALFLILTLNLNAQIAFTEDTTVPFIGVDRGDSDFADVDGDGDQDVIITGLVGGTSVANLYLNDGIGNFSLAPGTPFTPVYISTVNFADVDGDNDMDVFITGEDGGVISGVSELYINDGLGNFTLDTVSIFIGIIQGHVSFADVDNDNDKDVLLTGRDGGPRLYINNGAGIFAESIGQPIEVVGGFPYTAFADIDGDNDLDLMISGQNIALQSSTKLYANDGFGNYSLVLGAPFPQGNNGSITFGDTDNDGDLDVFFTGYNSNTGGTFSDLFLNDGIGNFTLYAPNPFQRIESGESVLFDADGDGNLDILLTGISAGLQAILYSNDCYGDFTEVTGMPFLGVTNSSISLADVDGDGDLDILTTGGTALGPGSNLYINESTPQPTSSFITTWRTTTANESITIPTSFGVFNYDVDWGDGIISTGETNQATHSYATPAVYQVTITGTFPAIQFNAGTDNRLKILSVDQWGCNPWASMEYAFYGCSNLVINAPDTPNLNNVTNASHMFDNCTALGGGTGNWNWDTSTITDMSQMFIYTDNFNQDIGTWDTGNVTTMFQMFYSALAFNQNIDGWDTSSVTNMNSTFGLATVFNQPLNNWDTSSVTNFSTMFNNAYVFNSPIGNWDTGNATDMLGMFSGATSFNQNIGSWNTSNVVNMGQMFASAPLFNQDIGAWDTSNVLNLARMFASVNASFDQDLGNWNVENVTDASGMFDGATLSIANYDSLLIGWNAQNLNPNVIFDGGLSKYCAGEAARANMIANDGWIITDSGKAGATIIDLPDPTAESLYVLPAITGTNLSGTEAYFTGPNGTGNTYNAGDVIRFADFPSYPVPLYIYDGIPAGCSSEESFQLILNAGCEFITTWETTLANQTITLPTTNQNGAYNYNVDWGDGTFTFGATGNSGHVYALPGTHQITITGLFTQLFWNVLTNPESIISVDQWGCNPWTSMKQAFAGCSNLVINALDVPNLSNVTDMSQMFFGATSLGGGAGNWNWDTSNVTSMEYLFSQANNFNKDIGGWDTSNVTLMNHMFYQGFVFNQDIGAWNTSNVTNMSTMFYATSAFNQDISNWDTSNVTSFETMFQNATAFNQDLGNWVTTAATTMAGMFAGTQLFNQDIGAWDTSNVVNMDVMFADAISFDQDLGNWDVENATSAINMFARVTLSTPNYDSLLIGWDAQNLIPNVSFSGGFSKYCAGEAARANMIASDGWVITDGGFAGSTVNDLADQTVTDSFTFPIITGTNLSGNEAYYTLSGGNGTIYNMGDIVNYADFPSYPVTLYIYDSPTPGCSSEENFLLTITCSTLWYADTDSDGFGDPASSTQACSAPPGYVADNTDCDDTNNTVYPGAPELCDGLDNDCDGVIPVNEIDDDGDGFSECEGDCDDTNNTVYPGAPELCDGLDNNCDGTIDEGVTTTYFADTDGDGFGHATSSTQACSPPPGYVPDNTDCDDTNNTVYPGAPELCDGLDNDCDGVIPTNEIDNDGDGYSTCEGDCDDTNNTVYPGAPELCDGLDNNCDGTIDEGVTTAYYADTDGDGFGDASSSIEACTPPTGYVLDNTDCDDANANINPNALEICDGIDNNCDGIIDEGVTTTFYADTDGDGFGDAANSIEACSVPPGYVQDNTDCDDTNGTTYPGAPELCDGIDSNCDGIIEEPFVQALQNQTVTNSYTLPTIVGTNLSGNEAYYTGPSGTGSMFVSGEIIDFYEFTSYPITLYIYDSYTSGCSSEESFELIIILPLACTGLNDPFDGSTDVSINTDVSWDAVIEATGYTLSIGTSSGGANIVNTIDVGNALTYDLPDNLPYNTRIYVNITPYNDNETALGCFEESFVTEREQLPPKFFTPNNDGTNDRWIIPNKLNNITTVYIYDRYGKLLKEIKDIQSGWDGTYNNKPLPTSDYWYMILYNEGKELTGHFSLVR